MKLFHQLEENDQHNCIHYCLHTVVEDLLADDIEIEPFTEGDKKVKKAIEKAVDAAKKMEEDDQFEFLINHKEIGSVIFDMAIERARETYYFTDNEMVIFYEGLRPNKEDEKEELEKEEIKQEILDEVKINTKNPKHSIN